MVSDTTVPLPESTTGERFDPAKPMWALAILWTNEEHDRRGQVGLLEKGVVTTFGRGPAKKLLETFRQLPGGRSEPGLPFSALFFSREQLELVAHDDHVHVKVVGQRRTFFNGDESSPLEIDLREHDIIRVKGHALMMLVKRPRALPTLRHLQAEHFGALGEPNVLGYVGESPAVWKVSDELLAAAATDLNVLMLGETGVGKDDAAKAIHARSSRSKGPFIAKNCAAMPDTLLEAELLGAIKGYPNERSPALPGAFGAAAHGTLFLDELGELAEDGQAVLLRALEGDLGRLGDPTPRPTHVRVVAATNRPIANLKPDIPPRFKIKIKIPNLKSRLEDIGFLLEYFLKCELQTANPLAVGKKITPEVIERIAIRMARRKDGVSGNIRELQGRLVQWLMGQEDEEEELAQEPERATELVPERSGIGKRRKLTVNDVSEVRDRLKRAGGVVAEVARQMDVDSWNLRYFVDKQGLRGK